MDGLPPRTPSGLSDAQIQQLFRRWKLEGDHVARDLLVERYLPLAYSLARRYHGTHEPIGDLRQVAAVGLIKAIDNFDLERGFGFPTFAVPSILGELRRYFRDHGWSVHLPRSAQELALKVDKAREELERSNATVTAQMIAAYLDLSTEEVLDGLEAKRAHHSLSYDMPSADQGEGDGDEPTILDRLGDDDGAYAAAEIGIDLERASQVLTAQERTVLALRFDKDLTQSEIAAEIGVSQMQVSRIVRRALEKFAQQMREPETPRSAADGPARGGDDQAAQIGD